MREIKFMSAKSALLLCIRICLLIFVVVTLSACSILDDDESEEVTVKVLVSQLIVSNHTTEVVYYAVFPRYILPLADWLPCSDPIRCTNKIQPGLWAVVKFNDFMGEKRDDEAVVYWWHSVKKLDEGSERYEPDEIRAIVVKL